MMDIDDLNVLMLPLPKGSIQLRDDRIQKVWTVQIEPFFLSKYLVTQRQYQNLIGRNSSICQGENLPVENVSWFDAVIFCNELSLKHQYDLYYNIEKETNLVTTNVRATGYRLPTEAEWEFACKAGNKSVRYGPIDDIAWYKENSNGHLQAVGTKNANDWGLFDMLGNVWEWCDDIYDAAVYGEYRIFRGGGWADEARSVLATNRRRSHPSSFRIDDLGFRIARSNKVKFSG